MGHGAVADGPDEHERRRPQGPAQGPAQEVERGIFQPVQAVAQGAARVVDIGQPGGGDGGRVDVGGRVGPRDERRAGQGCDPEDGVGGGVQSGRSLATRVLERFSGYGARCSRLLASRSVAYWVRGTPCPGSVARTIARSESLAKRRCKRLASG